MGVQVSQPCRCSATQRVVVISSCQFIDAKRKQSAAFLLRQSLLVRSGDRRRALATHPVAGNGHWKRPGAEKARSDRIREVILVIAVWPGPVLDPTNESTCVPASLLSESLEPSRTPGGEGCADSRFATRAILSSTRTKARTPTVQIPEEGRNFDLQGERLDEPADTTIKNRIRCENIRSSSGQRLCSGYH